MRLRLSLGLGPRGVQVMLALVVLLFCAAPVPGDVGGCGQDPQQLDPQTFFWSFQRSQCERCQECGINTQACERACSPMLTQTEFPQDCVPLVHDGEVCLRALQQDSCGDFVDYMSDSAPTVPSECDFCPTRGQP
jgi:hypothetical protein